VAENSTGYFGVTLVKRSQLKPYKARVRRGGKQVDLGMFATTEEAALCASRARRRGGGGGGAGCSGSAADERGGAAAGAGGEAGAEAGVIAALSP
jgi:hypothetical protein